MNKLLPTLCCLPALFACGDVSSPAEQASDRSTSDASWGHIARGLDPTQGIPVVDQAAAGYPPRPPPQQAAAQQPPASAAAGAGAAAPSSAAATPPSTAPAAPATPPAAAAAPAAAGQQPQQRATVREYIRKLMDETRVVPDTAAKKGGPRGSPGSFAKLSAAQVEEFVSAIIDGARLFMPKALTDEQRWALVAAEISIESAFTPGTKGVNPGDSSKVSVGPLQLTLPGMWDDIFRQYAKIPGLAHYNGAAWDPAQTQNDALESSIYDGVLASLWCITETARRGCPEWFGGPDGPLPRTMHTAFLAWVIGGPALKSGGDLAGQKDAYIASIETDLKLLGFDIGLVHSAL